MHSKHNKQLVPLAKKLRKEMTKEERRLWYDFLRSYPVRFSRQKVLGKYIVDFYSAEARLVIELDGSQHYEDDNMRKDAERTAFLKIYGLTVIRVPNNEVSSNFSGVCEYIDTVVKQSLSLTMLDRPLYTRIPYIKTLRVIKFTRRVTVLWGFVIVGGHACSAVT